MKTYILRDPQAVEPQTTRLVPPPDPATAALVERILSAGRGPVLYIGLDVHTESIAVSLAPSDATEVRRYGMIGGTHDDVLRLAKKLQAVHPGVTLKFCYEADRTGIRCVAVCAPTVTIASWWRPRGFPASPVTG